MALVLLFSAAAAAAAAAAWSAQLRRRSKRRRVYMDGCFDMMHAGHFNALRQASRCAEGAELVVGVVGDAEIVKAKGSAPVIPEAERVEQVQLCRWVDEVLDDVPYDLHPSFVGELLGSRHRVDLVVHGDDPCLLPDGTDAYAEVKRQGRFVEVPRTEGISSTDIVGRILGHVARESAEAPQLLFTGARVEEFRHGGEACLPPPVGHTSPVVGYVDGAFDLCHVGHATFLRMCREHCDVLIVGCHADGVVRERRRRQHAAARTREEAEERAPLPLLSLHERCLALWAQRAVSDVVVGAPLCATADLLATLRVRKVFRGTVSEGSGLVGTGDRLDGLRKRRLVFELKSPSSVTTHEVVRRVLNRKDEFEKRYETKSAREAAYYFNKSSSRSPVNAESNRNGG
ncbi:ethanolamine-phosphate cytidylyltransferase [Pseudoscourfieldia marina]